MSEQELQQLQHINARLQMLIDDQRKIAGHTRGMYVVVVLVVFLFLLGAVMMVVGALR